MKTFLRNISKNLWAYILWILFAVLLWLWLFGFLTRIKPEERVNVFIGSYSHSFDKYDELNNNRPDYIKKVFVSAYSVTSINFNVYLSVFGYNEGDIIILPESRVTDKSCTAHFSEISPFYQTELNNLGLYAVEDKVYGIKIHDKLTGESLVSCLDYGETDEDFYLFFNRKSQHIANLSDGVKNGVGNGAIETAQGLLTL